MLFMFFSDESLTSTSFGGNFNLFLVLVHYFPNNLTPNVRRNMRQTRGQIQRAGFGRLWIQFGIGLIHRILST